MAAIQGLFFTCILAATLAVVVVVHGVPTPSPSTNCLDILLSDVKECLFYVREGSDAEKPSGSCCTGLNKVAETHGECICFAIKYAPGFGMPVDIDRAAYLPSACGVTKDIRRSCHDVVSTSPGSSPVYAPAFSPTPVSPPALDSPIPAPLLSPAPDSPIPAPLKSLEPPSPSVLPPAPDSPIPARPTPDSPDSPLPAPLKSSEPPSPSPPVLPPASDSPIIPAPPKSSEPPSPPAPDSPAPLTSSEPPSPSPAPASPIPAPPSPSVMPPAAACPTAPPKSSEPSSPTSAPLKSAAPSGPSPAPEVVQGAENSAGYGISSFSVAVSAAAAALVAFMFVVA